MSPRFALLAGLATVAAQWLLHAGLLAGLPSGVRLLLAFLALVVSPGAALLVAARVRIPGGPLFGAGWAIAAGIALLGALVLLTRAAHQPFTVLAIAGAWPAALLWVIASWRSRGDRAGAARAGQARPAAPVVVAIAAAAALALVHGLQLPTPVGYNTDSPDHIGTLRRMVATGDAFPADAFFRDAGAAGADPRKGLWHPVVALTAVLARVDVLPAWQGLSALLAATFVLSAAGLGWLIGGGSAAAVAAWALLLTYGASLASQYLREAVFAAKLADQLALVTAAAVLHDLDERSAPSRAGAILVGLGAVATHVFAALQFALVFAALAAGLAVRERGAGPLTRRLLATAALLGLVCLPYLAWRAKASYGPVNVIHTEKQGMLTLWPGAEIVTFGVLWQWMGLAWVAIPAAWPALARACGRPAVLMLFTTSLAVTLVLFCPPVVALLQPRLGYLTMRFVWVYPFAGILAFSIVGLARGIGRRSPLAIAGALGLAGLLAGPVRDGAEALVRPRTFAAVDSVESVLRWRAALAWMDTGLPQGSVVLSDPATSYSIPMLTRHWVQTLVDQHSSPNDPLALARMLDARDALDPGSPWSRTREVIQRWGVTAIALNNRFAEAPHLDYWGPSPEWFREARARLDAAPAAFRRVYDRGDFVVYQVHRSSLDSLQGGARPREYVRAAPAGGPAAGAGREPRVAAAGESPHEVVAGDSLSVWVDWTAAARQPAGSYVVAVRFDQPLPGGPHAPAWLAKPVRKIAEKLRGARYRFRSDHLPVEGRFGVDAWEPNTLVRDSVRLRLPDDLAPGTYVVQAHLIRQPHYANLRLSDYFFDHDYFSGARIGSIRVLPGARGH